MHRDVYVRASLFRLVRGYRKTVLCVVNKTATPADTV